MKTLALLAALLMGTATIAATAHAYTSCTTTCYGNTCTRTCF
jgi:hypothetical protein